MKSIASNIMNKLDERLEMKPISTMCLVGMFLGAIGFIFLAILILLLSAIFKMGLIVGTMLSFILIGGLLGLSAALSQL